MLYNITNLTNTSNPGQLFVNVSNAANGWPSYVLLIMIFVITMALYRLADIKRVLIAASSSTLFVSIILWQLEAIDISVVYGPFFILLASVMIYFLSGSE